MEFIQSYVDGMADDNRLSLDIRTKHGIRSIRLDADDGAIPVILVHLMAECERKQRALLEELRTL